MSALRSLFLAVVCLSFAACATTHNNSPAHQNLVLARLAALHIDTGTYVKIANHRVLSYSDILGLLQKDVPSKVILTYIQSTHAPYTLTDSQLQKLNNAGASADLLNYLGKSVGFFEATERSQTGGAGKWKNDPFFVDPYYMGEPPFAYGFPGEWYDPVWVGSVF